MSGRFALQGTIDQATHDKLRYAQELLSHQIPSGDLVQVLARLLDLALPQLERRKFAAAANPRATGRRPSRSLRHIPADVMRAVWARDQGRCTFITAEAKLLSTRCRTADSKPARSCNGLTAGRNPCWRHWPERRFGRQGSCGMPSRSAAF